MIWTEPVDISKTIDDGISLQLFNATIIDLCALLLTTEAFSIVNDIVNHRKSQHP